MHCSELGDHIGLESCVDMMKLDDYNLSDTTSFPPPTTAVDGGRSRRQKSRESIAMKEYPPPIPLLANNENLPPHVPSVLKRYYSDDGRLVIVQEKVRRHEYLESHRADGRLVINLIAFGEEDKEEEEEENEVVEGGEEINGDGEGTSDDPMAYNVGVNSCGGAYADGAAAVAFTPPAPVHT